jgi:hypothetical protein
MIVETLVPSMGQTHIDALFDGSSREYVLRPYDTLTLEFLNDVSRRIITDAKLKSRAEYVALAFWLRKSVLLRIKDENKHLFETESVRVSPLGTVLHICPANVDTMFLYSMAVSLLMGNRNILKVSKRTDSEELFRLFAILNEAITTPKFQCFASYIRIIQYQRNDHINEALSMMANCRVIWGGDATVAAFKSVRTAPRTKDLAFADRISVLVLKSASVLGLKGADMDEFVQKFYNDTYTFDQLGCSSPQTIFMVGTQQQNAECVKLLSEKLTRMVQETFAVDAASLGGLKFNRRVEDAMEGRIETVAGNSLCTFAYAAEGTDVESMKSCGGGYFYVRQAESVEQLGIPSSSKIQTVAYFGISDGEKNMLIDAAMGEGIDRVVPLGRALEFNYVWDGYNLLDELSKKVQVY